MFLRVHTSSSKHFSLVYSLGVYCSNGISLVLDWRMKFPASDVAPTIANGYSPHAMVTQIVLEDVWTFEFGKDTCSIQKYADNNLSKSVKNQCRVFRTSKSNSVSNLKPSSSNWILFCFDGQSWISNRFFCSKNLHSACNNFPNVPSASLSSIFIWSNPLNFMEYLEPTYYPMHVTVNWKEHACLKLR